MKGKRIGLTLFMGGTAVLILYFCLQNGLTRLSAGGIYQDNGQSLGGDTTYDVALADLDGDGDVDAFAANGTFNRLYFNDGTGCFDNSGQHLGNQDSRGVALADLNGDTHLDAFIANRGADNEVWLNDSQGNLLLFSQTMNPSAKSWDVALGNLAGVAGLDAFVANEDGFEVWSNNGTAVFSLSQSFGGPNTSGREIALGDLDGDTDLDAYIANGGNSQEDEIWFNNGGTFISATQTLSFDWNEGVALGDLDGDDDLDLFLANWFGSDSVWINQGGIQAGTEGEFVNSGQTLSGNTSMDVTLVDVNDDTVLDAVVAKWTATNGEIWLNDGSGNFSLSSADLDASASYAIASANLDGDNVDDLFFGNFGANHVYLTSGCRNLARFDVESRQNLAGQHQYPWAQAGDALLPILLNFVPDNAVNVLAGIETGNSVMTDTISFAPSQTMDDLTVTNPQPTLSETVTITLRIELQPPQTDVVPPLSLTFINVGEDDTLCSLCFVDWLLKLMGFETSFWLLHHMQVSDLRGSDSWNYYQTLFANHNDELTTIIATNPELLWQTWDALDGWTPAVQSIDDGNADMVTITQPMVDDAVAVLEGIQDNASPQLAAQIQTEMDVLDFDSMAGLTMADVASRVENRIAGQVFFPVISR